MSSYSVDLTLGYTFTVFAVGMGCLGGALLLTQTRQHDLARGFLAFYVPLSLLVLGALLLAFMAGRTESSAEAVFMVEYLEAFVGRYGVMLGLPLFAHRVFGTPRGARDTMIVGVVVAAFLAKHITEFAVDGPWDKRGDLAADLLFAAVLAYTIWLGTTRLSCPATFRVLASRFFALLLVGVPVAAHDLILIDGPGLRLYPMWYCAVGVTMICGMLAGHALSASGIPAAWGLTPREEEVVGLALRGLSNGDIALELSISPNTVKTHLQAIFKKSGCRSRVALIAVLAAPSAAAPGSLSPGGQLS
jgi:DNA-binding CsgD family transcriptional regulator